MVYRELEKVYQQYYQQVFSFLFRLSGSAEAAEEMTSETFFLAFRSLRMYDGECDFFTWLCVIAKNVFFRALKKSKLEFFTLDVYVLDLAAALNEEPGRQLTKDIGISRLREVLLGMPKRYSDILILHLFAEIPFRELALRLRISETTAKVIFTRAKNIIREELIDE